MRTQIVYEDQDILICHKPAGLATQSAAVSQPDVVSELKNYLAGNYLGIVHRLDQPVEGLLVFARNKKAAAALSSQLARGSLHKKYCALVYGRLSRESGELVDYLRKEGNLARVVAAGDPEGKKAVLRYQVRRRESVGAPGMGGGADGETENCTCLDIEIDTGRFHQIRCQLSHAGNPILGDRKYGTAESLEASRRLGISQTALCACGICLRHPVTGQEISYEIKPDWRMGDADP